MPNLKVSDAMVKTVIEISPDVNIQQAAQAMREKDVGMLVVCENNQIIGVITREDLVNNILAENKNPSEITIRDQMTMNPMTCAPSDNLIKIAKIMITHGYKRLPVLFEGKLVGLISYQEVIKVLPAEADLLEEIQNKMDGSELPQKKRSSLTAGECESCSNFDANLKDINGKWLCPECVDDE
jgi:CBS domain-containing protein